MSVRVCSTLDTSVVYRYYITANSQTDTDHPTHQHHDTQTVPIILNTRRWTWLFSCCLLIISPPVTLDQVEWIWETQPKLHAVTHQP